MPFVRFSAFCLALFGAGLCFFPKRTRAGEWPDGGLFTVGALALCFSHSLIYAGVSVRESIGVIFACGIAGSILAASGARRRRFLPQWDTRATGIALIFLLPTILIVGEPLVGWDARSIWFFHSKIIFYHGGLLATSAWAKPEIAFSHPDYPKLIPLLGAQAAELAGYWNDYWPKLGLLCLLTLLQAALHALPWSTRKVWTISFVLFAGLGYLLWNGYADAYLAGFAFIAAVNLSLTARKPDRATLWRAVAALALMVQLKNEGTALAVLLAACFGVALFRNGNFRTIHKAWDFRMVSLFIPQLLWLKVKADFALKNDLATHFSDATVKARLFDPAFWKLFGYHYFVKSPLLFAIPGFLALALYARLKWRQKPVAGIYLALATCAIYSGVLAFVYLSTYLPLEDHLQSSLGRVTLAVATLLLAAACFFEPPSEKASA